MPIQVHGVLLHTITGTELSRVRTELEGRRVLVAIAPHPVQASPQPSSHRYLGNVPLPAHGQVSIAAPRRLRKNQKKLWPRISTVHESSPT
jgi:hypothetical protein